VFRPPDHSHQQATQHGRRAQLRRFQQYRPFCCELRSLEPRSKAERKLPPRNVAAVSWSRPGRPFIKLLPSKGRRVAGKMADTEAAERVQYQPLRSSERPSQSSEEQLDRMNSQWCLTVAVVTFLCAVSLIGLSEGWLEAMGLGRHVVHDKDCSSPLFTHETLKLLHEEPIQRLAADRGSKGEDLLADFEASGIRFSVDSSDYYVVFDNSFYIGKFSSELDFHHHASRGSTNKLLPWPGKDPEEESGFEAITYNESSGTFLVVQVHGSPPHVAVLPSPRFLCHPLAQSSWSSACRYCDPAHRIRHFEPHY